MPMLEVAAGSRQQGPTAARTPQRGATAAKLRGESSKLRLGLIGCGAIVEQSHLPAALMCQCVSLTAICDTDERRLKYLQREFHLDPIAFPDYRDILDRVDAVILAVPNAQHATIGAELLSRGIHVLCEKPLAITCGECEQLCRAARTTSAVLAVGFVTRFFPSTMLTRQLLESGFLGQIRSFDYEYGTVGGWAPTSGYNLTRSSAGGGVLVVSGIHFIDRMLYLFDSVDVVSHADDARGGVEANSVTQFRAFVNGKPVDGRVTLSKTHKLQNRLRVVGDKGVLEIQYGQHQSVTFSPSEGGVQHEITRTETAAAKLPQNYFIAQLEDFAHAIVTGTSPKVDGEEGTKSVALIERCYALATPLSELEGEGDTARFTAVLPPSLSTPGRGTAETGSAPLRRVLVTGATGFIGGRLCEILATTSLAPRAFVHSTDRAARIMRFPLDFIMGDLCDREAVLRAVDGCDAVVHLAIGEKGVMERGLDNLLRAAVSGGVSRFVHMSSVAVYGDHPPPESVSETAIARFTGHEYGDQKLKQERRVLKYWRRHGLPVTILRPPNVYGPYSWFSQNMLAKLRSNSMPIVDRGENPCNLVYIDNLVEAILLALWKPEAVGQTFFVTDEEVVTWAECINEYAAVIGATVPHVSAESLMPVPQERVILDSLRMIPRVLLSVDFRRALRRIPVFHRIEQAAYNGLQSLPEDRRQQVRRWMHGSRSARPSGSSPHRFSATDNFIAAQGRTVVHSNSKARDVLGYTAAVSRLEGMVRTEAWLRFASLI